MGLTQNLSLSLSEEPEEIKGKAVVSARAAAVRKAVARTALWSSRKPWETVRSDPVFTSSSDEEERKEASLNSYSLPREARRVEKVSGPKKKTKSKAKRKDDSKE